MKNVKMCMVLKHNTRKMNMLQNPSEENSVTYTKTKTLASNTLKKKTKLIKRRKSKRFKLFKLRDY